MSVVFDDEGTITINGLTSGPVVLSRPTLGQYRTLRDAYRQAHKAMQAGATQAESITKDKKKHTDEEAAQLLEELETLLETWHHVFIALAASTLSKGLPEDTDEWPADLALDPIIPGRMLEHWRRVPLAHGRNQTP
jgi:hypothetical protein